LCGLSLEKGLLLKVRVEEFTVRVEEFFQPSPSIAALIARISSAFDPNGISSLTRRPHQEMKIETGNDE
jgi:hypothetical protein